MPYLGQSPKETFSAATSQVITGNGGTSYSLNTAVSSPEDLEVFINNVQQQPTTTYTVSGSTITFDEALNSTDTCYVIFRGSTKESRVHPAGSSLTAANITASGNSTIGGTLGVTGNTTLSNATISGDLTVDTDTIKTDATNNRVFINRTSQVTSHDAFVVSSPAGGVGGGNTRINATITAEDLTGDSNAHANAFIVTKAKGNYYNGLEISSTSAHIGGWIGHYGGGDNSRALQARIGGTGINASDILALKVDINGVVSMPIRGVLRGTNVEGVAGTTSSGTQTISATFPQVGYGAGFIAAACGHYGAGGYQAIRVSSFYAGPGFAEYNIQNSSSGNMGAFSFSWSSGVLTVSKSAGSYAGGGPFNIFVTWGRQ